MRRGQRTFRPDNKQDRRTCFMCAAQFYCTSKCPEDQPYHHHESMSDGSLKSYCADKPFIPPASLGVHQST